MKLFDAVSQTDYQDVFRMIGLMVDERKLRDVRIWEHADGLILQGCPPGKATFETIMLSDADLNEMLLASYERRQGGVKSG